MNEKISTRDAFGKALVEFGKPNPNLIVLDSDLAGTTKTGSFKKECPERFFDMGIAEADMMCTAAGLASCGKTVLAASFAVFAAGRAFEQIRNSIAYPKMNVKVVGSHGGITVGKDGATHQAIEDLALMQTLPNMTVLNPADAVEMRSAVKAMLEWEGPDYLRLGRMPVPIIHDESSFSFAIGKGIRIREGGDVTLISTGSLLDTAINAANALADQNIQADVIDIHTLKPLDEALLLESVRKTGCAVTMEDGLVLGGLGSAVATALSKSCPVPLRYVGMQNTFGQSGDPLKLMEYYGMSAENVVAQAREVMHTKSALPG